MAICSFKADYCHIVEIECNCYKSLQDGGRDMEMKLSMFHNAIASLCFPHNRTDKVVAHDLNE